jgi:hypothetical protein
MSHTMQQTMPQYSERTTMESEATGWVGWIFFAGIMLVLLGAFQAIAGLVGIFNDSYFLVPSKDLAVSVDYTAWGWVHLALGVLAVFAGYGVMKGRMWARVYAVIVAGLSAVVNLAFIGAYPVWGVIIIAVDLLVIYAVVVHGREVKAR